MGSTGFVSTKFRPSELRTAILAAVDLLPTHVAEKIRKEIRTSSPEELRAYLLGAMHDGTYRPARGTIRIAQSSLTWSWSLRSVFRQLGARSWCYQEGTRRVFVVESSFKLDRFLIPLGPLARAAFLRGYFDAEGGIPHSLYARFYIQFVQRDLDDLQRAHDWLEDLGIHSGRVHNPSHRVDPHYWRFYVASRSHRMFLARVGAWHPEKRAILDARLAGR